MNEPPEKQPLQALAGLQLPAGLADVLTAASYETPQARMSKGGQSSGTLEFLIHENWEG